MKFILIGYQWGLFNSQKDSPNADIRLPLMPEIRQLISTKLVGVI